MIYSVWNPGSRAFDYYRGPQRMKGANVGKPGHLKAHELGATPEQAAWPLPAGAVRVGQGAEARGRVAHIEGGKASMGDVVTPRNAAKAAILAGLGWLVYRELR